MRRCGARSRPLGKLLAVACCAAWFASASGASGAESSQLAGSTQGKAEFQAFVSSLWPEAERFGIRRASFDAAFNGMAPDPTVAAMTRRQPEEVKPLGAYLAPQVTGARAAQGGVLMQRWNQDLAAIERRFGVPRAIIVAIWGLETGYGASSGNKDVIRSLATLASIGYRADLYRTEVLSALAMLQNDGISREAMRGSWAGAMGQPQFMPSSFEKFAVDWDGDGRRDIWTSVPDALASIANFLRSQGWQPDRPWGFQVTLPAGFDYQVGRATYADWTSRGVVRADQSAMPASGEGILYSPAGANGPAFLVTPNFEVLKTYNFSDAYALSVAGLADRIEGGPGIKGPWPSDRPMSRDDRIALQARLAELGYTVDNREGRISLAFRDTVRVAQAKVNMVPDGNPTRSLLLALGAGSQRP